MFRKPNSCLLLLAFILIAVTNSIFAQEKTAQVSKPTPNAKTLEKKQTGTKATPTPIPKMPEWTYFEPANHCFKVKTLVPLRLTAENSTPIEHLRGDMMPHFEWFGMPKDKSYAFRVIYTDRPRREAGALDLVEGQARDEGESKLVQLQRVRWNNINKILTIHKDSKNIFKFGMHLIVGARLFQLDIITANFDEGIEMAKQFHGSFEMTCR